MVALESIYNKVNWLSLVAIYPVAIDTQRYASLQLLCLMQQKMSCNIDVAIELLLPIMFCIMHLLQPIYNDKIS
jgi:hypothetical protein